MALILLVLYNHAVITVFASVGTIATTAVVFVSFLAFISQMR